MNISECKEGMVVHCYLKKMGLHSMGVISEVLNNWIIIDGVDPIMMAVGPGCITELSLEDTERFKRSVQHTILLEEHEEFELIKLEKLRDKIQKRIEEKYIEMGIIKTERNLGIILEDAESTNDLKTLITLWNEIVSNKKKYALVDLVFANEKIRKLALKSNGSDVEIGNFCNFLKSQKDEVDSLKNEVISFRQLI